LFGVLSQRGRQARGGASGRHSAYADPLKQKKERTVAGALPREELLMGCVRL
jgi:hypothetical protein